MFKIKNYHFLLLLLFTTLFSFFLKMILQSITIEIIMLSFYLFYTFIIIFKLNDLFNSLGKYLKIYFLITYIFLFSILIYGYYLNITLNKLEYLEHSIKINESEYGQLLIFIINFCFLFSQPFLLTKVLLSCEKKEVVKVFSYTTDFLKFIIPPIAIWLMVPRINKVYENFLAENKENELQLNE